MKHKYYCWELEQPMDSNWELMNSMSEAIQFATLSDEELEIPELIANVWFAAHESLKIIGWEGDIRGNQQPKVFWIPCDYSPLPGIVFKQGNNGQTFVISPVDFSKGQKTRLFHV